MVYIIACGYLHSISFLIDRYVVKMAYGLSRVKDQNVLMTYLLQFTPLQLVSNCSLQNITVQRVRTLHSSLHIFL